MRSRRVRAARGLATEAMIRWLFDALHAAGVQPLLLKGISTHRWLYAEDDLPVSSDIDLLVAPRDFPAAERRLQQLGLVNRFDGPAPPWADEHSDRWDHEFWPAPVDLHRRLWEVGADPDRVWRVLERNREILTVSGRRIDILNERARALMVALHVAHHGPGPRKPRQELRLALTVVGDARWRESAELAEELDCLPQLVQGLRLDPEGSRLVSRLGLEHVAEPPAHQGAHLFEAPPSTEGFVRLATARGPERMRILWRELFPSRTFMRVRSSHAGIARKGPAGLLLAYCLRWAYLARNSIAGVRAAAEHRRRQRRP